MLVAVGTNNVTGVVTGHIGRCSDVSTNINAMKCEVSW
jgi:hypothetical protein